MILNLISLATVKNQLGIATGTTTYDSAITALIPQISTDIRRILNTDYNKYYTCAFSTSSNTIDLSVYSYSKFENYSIVGENEIKIGTVLYSAGLPADTYVNGYDPLTGLFTLSATPIATGTYVYPTVSISMWSAISKMIWYRYTKMNTTNSIVQSVTSESFGSVSISYSQKEINKQYDYPQQLVDDLGIPFQRIV